MTDDERRLIEELFLAAADLPLDQQQRLLDTACAGNAAVRADVESLLVAERRGAADIAGAIEREAMALVGEPSLVGARLGAYRVLREVGRGGMGAVYLATRDDDEFHKQVALKVVKRGMDTDEVLRRFRRERQILANLEHAYIARLIDGGSTADGRPFLVMEFVEGEPIDRYCSARGLSVAERCRLFLKVCEAVAHAHRNLVVHCDLKPGNILIASDGTPKLLDFGVARILDPAFDGDVTAALSARPLTPEYASPEQVRGAAASTTTDVYSLGVILYELLTGRKAHRITSPDPRELEKVICDTDLPSPSAAVAGIPGMHRLQRELAGDLDTIVMQATHKVAPRRYASVDQLADDLRCYLESRPVSALRDSWSYRAVKFVRRERATVIAAGSVALSLIVGIALALAQARQARIAKDSAEGRLAQIVSVSNRSLSDVYARLERLPGAVPARKQLIGTTVDLLEGVSQEAGADPRVKIALAKAYLKLAALQGDLDGPNVGDIAGGLRSSRAGAALLEPLAAVQDVDWIRLWADLQNQIGKALNQLAEHAAARRVLEGAIAAAEARGVRDGRSLAALYLSLSRVTTEDDAARALEWARKSLAIATSGARQAPSDTDLQMVLSAAYTSVGFLLVQLGHPQEAEAPYAASIRIREELASTHPNDLLFRRYLRLAYEHFGQLQGSPLEPSLGRPEIARAYYKKAQPLEEADRDDPDNQSARFDYANFLFEMAIIETPADGAAESLAALRTSAAILEALAAQEPGIQRYDRILAQVYEYMGHRLLAMKQFAEAAAAYRRSLTIAGNALRQSPGVNAYEKIARAAAEGLARARTLGHLTP